MNENQFSAMLAIIVPQIVEQIVKNSNISEVKAVECFYRSNLYQELADETSKLWHYSPLLLYTCLLYTSPSPRDRQKSRMPSSA